MPKRAEDVWAEVPEETDVVYREFEGNLWLVIFRNLDGKTMLTVKSEKEPDVSKEETLIAMGFDTEKYNGNYNVNIYSVDVNGALDLDKPRVVNMDGEDDE